MCENNIICEELQQCCNNPLFYTECNEHDDCCHCCTKPNKKHKCCCCKFMEKVDQVEDIANEIKQDYSTIKSRIIGNENLIEENRDRISEEVQRAIDKENQLESLITGGVDLDNYYTKFEVDRKISSIVIDPVDPVDLTPYAKTEDVYTKSQVDNQQQQQDLEIAKKADRASLSTVATSGSYNDLSNKPIIPSTNGLASEQYVRNYTYNKQTIDEKVAQGGTFDPTNYYTKSEIDNANDAYDTELNNKVDKVSGKGLSTNDYTTAEKNKLAGIDAGANANVNADWNATSGDAKILNKPTIPSIEGLASEQYVSNYTYDKQTIDEKVAEGGTFDPTQYYNKTTTDQRINTATSDMATMTWVGNQGYITTSDIPEGAAASTTTPKMDGTASVGTELAFARGDHRHPSDTTKVDKVSGKGLSTNDYTTAEKEKLASLDNVTESTVSGWGFTKNTGTYSKPSGGIPKTDLASSVQTSLGKADTALQSFTETDPTVPAWAKQTSKPTYTASEVGALPANTQLFSGDYNDLTNKPTIPDAVIVDSTLSKTSTHPVQNKVITEALENVGGNPDRSYDPTAHSGLGRKTFELKEGVSNVLTQEDFSDANTIYVIRYDFILGEDIDIPANCVLEFDGGSISASGSNDTITGTNTGISAGLIKILDTDITLAGTWNVAEAYPEWFGAKSDGITDDTDAIKKCVIYFNNIIINKGTYLLSSYIPIEKPTSIRGFDANLISNEPLRFFWITSNNVVIENLNIKGVAEGYPEKDSTTARASYLIDIGSLAGGCNNVIINNCILSDATGAVMIEPTSSNIIVSNCIMKDMKYIPTSLDNPGADGAGGYGVVCHYTDSASPTNNIKIYNNVFDNIPRHCAYIQKCINVDFYNNTIRNSIVNVSSGSCAVHDAGVDNFNIHHNYFYEVYKGIGIANYDSSAIINPIANIHDNYFKVTESAIEMMSTAIKKLKINNNTVFGKAAFIFNSGAQICDSEIRGNYIKGSVIGNWNHGFIQVAGAKMFQNVIIDNNVLINDAGQDYSACISFKYNNLQTDPIYKNIVVSNNILSCPNTPDGRGIDIQENSYIQLLIISNNRIGQVIKPIYVTKASTESYIVAKDNIWPSEPDATSAIDVYEDNIVKL